MSSYIENLVLPLSDLIQGQEIKKSLDFLKKSQWWSKEQIDDFQGKKLKELVKFASSSIPFYNKWLLDNHLGLEDFKNLQDLSKLPVVDKTLIRDHPEQFMQSDRTKKESISIYSSGSTGEPFGYLISRNAYSMKYAAALRGWYWMGYELGDKYVKLSQNRRSLAIKKIQDFINRCAYVYIPDLTQEGLRQAIKKIEKERPAYLRCYPDPLYFMAIVLKNENRFVTGIKAINTTGNILTCESRRLIEERFCCPVFDSYSCEGGALFYEGPTRENYLGSAETAITEVLRTDGSAAAPGETGMHVTTDLWNYAMPFIRYNTQDLVKVSEKRSSCGRHLPSLDSISGRDNDILVTPSGNLLIVHLFTIYFEYFSSIRQFQVEQTGTHEFIFRLVVDESFTSGTRSMVEEYWKKFIGDGTRIIIEIHDEIPLLHSGKRRFLIRNPEIKISF